MSRPLIRLAIVILVLGVASAVSAPERAPAQEKLVVWWNKGYYPEEDAAMQKIVKEFEAKHKVEVDLSFTAQEDLLKKINAALIARRVPDVAFIRSGRNIATDAPIEGAPDLAVEVISPSNTPREIDQRVSDYFTAGCRRVPSPRRAPAGRHRAPSRARAT